jgi:hypothetical protein
MPIQTRIAFGAEYQAALDSGNTTWISEVEAAAKAYDKDHPDEPSLMAELLGMRYEVAA